MITSVNNGQVKNIIQLNQKTKARREQGLFVAEGRKMFGEAPADWIEKVYVSETLTSDPVLMEQVEKLPYDIVADSVFRQMSECFHKCCLRKARSSGEPWIPGHEALPDCTRAHQRLLPSHFLL